MKTNDSFTQETPLTFEQASIHIAADTFKHLDAPSDNIMLALIDKTPRSVFRMPQASKDLQIAAVKRQGTLLLTNFQWQFDTETIFPGSTCWRVDALADIYQDAVFIHHVHHDDELVCDFEPSWRPVRLLSDWAPENISVADRDVLKNGTTAESMTRVFELLKRGQRPVTSANGYSTGNLSDAGRCE